MVWFWVPPNSVNFECSVHFFRGSYTLQLNITNWLTFAFKTLLTKSKHNCTTVIAPYQFIVRMDNKTMCHIYFDYTIILRIRNIKNLKKKWKRKLKKTCTYMLFVTSIHQFPNSPIHDFFIKIFIYLLFFLDWNDPTFCKSWESIKMHFTVSLK